MSRAAKLVHRGLTLPEVMVAAFLMALFLGIVTRFFQIGQRVAGEELDRTHAEATLLALTRKLRSDLATASAGGLSLSEDGETLLIHPVEITDVGTVVYDSRLILWSYDATEKELERRVTESYSGFTFDGTPYKAPESVLVTLAGSSEFGRSALFRRLTKFQLSSVAGVTAPFIGPALNLEVEAEIPRSSTRNTVTLNSTFQLRNSGV